MIEKFSIMIITDVTIPVWQTVPQSGGTKSSAPRREICEQSCIYNVSPLNEKLKIQHL